MQGSYHIAASVFGGLLYLFIREYFYSDSRENIDDVVSKEYVAGFIIITGLLIWLLQKYKIIKF
jgi:hypothetical protein|tara:strand:+ start:352 stop:543 length:192 start_codon:yes stop_codon:yes gene_type:complete